MVQQYKFTKERNDQIRVEGLNLFYIDPHNGKVSPNEKYTSFLIDPKTGVTSYDVDRDFQFLDVTGTRKGNVHNGDTGEFKLIGSYSTPRHGNYFDQEEYKVVAHISDVKDVLAQLKEYLNNGDNKDDSKDKVVVKTSRPVSLYIRVSTADSIKYVNLNQKVPLTIKLDDSNYYLYLGDRQAMEITGKTIEAVRNNFRAHKPQTIIGTYLKSLDYPTPAVYMNTSKLSGEICVHTTVLHSLIVSLLKVELGN